LSKTIPVFALALFLCLFKKRIEKVTGGFCFVK